jgi:hypothetical protein
LQGTRADDLAGIFMMLIALGSRPWPSWSQSLSAWPLILLSEIAVRAEVALAFSLARTGSRLAIAKRKECAGVAVDSGGRARTGAFCGFRW